MTSSEVTLFELACLAIVAATLAAMTRARLRSDATRKGAVRALFANYVVLALAAWAGEETCIRLYRFYAYAPTWHVRIVDVPLLVPLIWPLVVLSARDVVSALAAGPPGSRPPSALVLALGTGAVVAFDASLVEVVAVRAGLWSWSEPGHLGVPLIGILGWGFFAFGSTLPRGRLTGALLGLAATHGLVLATWWGLFRFALRGSLGAQGFMIIVAASAAFLVAALRARSRGALLTPQVWGPRVIAAALFGILLVFTAPRDPSLWLHAALVAAPYLVATRFRAATSAR